MTSEFIISIRLQYNYIHVVKLIVGQSPLPSAWSNSAIGSPTCFDLPTTTAFFPKVSILLLSTNSLTAKAVAGTILLLSSVRLPRFFKWKPSTSFLGIIAWHTSLSFMLFGSGNCTRTPSTDESLLRLSISLRSSACVMFSPKWIV